MRTDRHEETFRNFANAPKKGKARDLPSSLIGTVAFMKPRSSSQFQETPASFSIPSPDISVHHVPLYIISREMHATTSSRVRLHVRCKPQHPHVYVADYFCDHNGLLFQTSYPKISERNPANSPSCWRNVPSYLNLFAPEFYI